MSARRAFTLMEALLALALMMMLLSAFYVFLRGTGTAQQVAREAASRQLNARTLCDLIERDLTCCIVGDATSGAGVKGSASELHVLTRAVASSLATAGYGDRTALADLESATFTFRESVKEASIRREIKRSVALPSRDGEAREPSTASSAESIGPIHRLRFRYYDGSTWAESFDSLAQNRLPIAVEIAIWLHPIEQEDDDGAWPTKADSREGLADEFGADEMPAMDPDDSGLVSDDESIEEKEEDDVPPPDVVRIVIIPDAEPGESEAEPAPTESESEANADAGRSGS